MPKEDLNFVDIEIATCDIRRKEMERLTMIWKNLYTCIITTVRQEDKINEQ